MASEKSRGEVGELRSQLMRLSGGGSNAEKIAQKRDLFRRVIMLGTIGQDMSSLFMQARATSRATLPRLRVARSAYHIIVSTALFAAPLALCAFLSFHHLEY